MARLPLLHSAKTPPNLECKEGGDWKRCSLLARRSSYIPFRQGFPQANIAWQTSSHLRDGRIFSLRSELGRRSEVQWKRSKRGRMYGWGGREGCRMREPRVPSKCLSFPVRLSTLFVPPPTLPAFFRRTTRTPNP